MARVKNNLSEGVAWLDSEGLGLACPAASQEDAKTQTSFTISPQMLY